VRVFDVAADVTSIPGWRRSRARSDHVERFPACQSRVSRPGCRTPRSCARALSTIPDCARFSARSRVAEFLALVSSNRQVPRRITTVMDLPRRKTAMFWRCEINYLALIPNLAIAHLPRSRGILPRQFCNRARRFVMRNLILQIRASAAASGKPRTQNHGLKGRDGLGHASHGPPPPAVRFGNAPSRKVAHRKRSPAEDWRAFITPASLARNVEPISESST